MYKHKHHAAFTIVELAVVILIIGILTSVSYFGFNAWRDRVAASTLKSDLTSAAAQLESELQWKNIFPETKELANDSKGLPTSDGTTFEYTRTSNTSYCLTATSDHPGIPAMMITNDNTVPREGVCEGHEGLPVPGLGEAWVAQEVAPGSRGAIAYGDGKFVALGIDHAIVSTNGISWSRYSMSDNILASSMAYGNGKFVLISSASGGGAKGRVSSDGENWTTFNMPSPNAVGYYGWKSIAYGNGRFVAVTDYGTNKIAISTDGAQTWTTVAAPEQRTWGNITYGGGRFVVTGYSSANRTMTSTDGVNWTLGTIPGSTSGNKSWQTAYGSGKFVAVSSSTEVNSVVSVSTDGVVWSEPTPLAGGSTRLQGAIAYGGGKFVVVPNSNKTIYTSTDGQGWSSKIIPTIPVGNPQFLDVVYGNGKFAAPSANTSWVISSP